MAEYVASWSGGKDGCLACWKAFSQGLKVSYLLNLINAEAPRSMSHGLDHKIIALQAKAMNIPIIQQKSTRGNYEAAFKAALSELKTKGVTGLVTGDIYVQEHKDWIDRVCTDMEMESVQPLWLLDTTQLYKDFIDAGFKSIVVSVKSELFGKEWLGRELNSKFAEDVIEHARKMNLKVDPCGESGEFHTFVFDGPLFKRPVKILKSDPVLKEDKRWYLDILEYELG